MKSDDASRGSGPDGPATPPNGERRADAHEREAIDHQLRQWRSCFRLGVVLIALGSLLTAGVVISAIADWVDLALTAVLIGAVSVVFVVATALLWQAGRARVDALRLLERSRGEEHANQALQLVGSIADDKLRANVIALLALRLTGSTSDDGLLDRLPDLSPKDSASARVEQK